MTTKTNISKSELRLRSVTKGRRSEWKDFSSIQLINYSINQLFEKGHEHLPRFGLINMNARLYDPAVGRFLSPDNYIQDPTNSQNFNRYSYCLNNPLKYVDLTGEIYWYQDGDGNWKFSRDPLKNNDDDFFGYNWNDMHRNKDIFGWGGFGSSGNMAYYTMMGILNNSSSWYSYVNGHMYYVAQSLGFGDSDEGYWAYRYYKWSKNNQGTGADRVWVRTGNPFPEPKGSELGFGSTVIGIAGARLQTMPHTFRFTNSKGQWDLKLYITGWRGNQWVSTKSVAGLGRNVSGVGTFVGGIFVALDARQLHLGNISRQQFIYSAAKFGVVEGIGWTLGATTGVAAGATVASYGLLFNLLIKPLHEAYWDLQNRFYDPEFISRLFRY